MSGAVDMLLVDKMDAAAVAVQGDTAHGAAAAAAAGLAAPGTTAARFETVTSWDVHPDDLGELHAYVTTTMNKAAAARNDAAVDSEMKMVPEQGSVENTPLMATYYAILMEAAEHSTSTYPATARQNDHNQDVSLEDGVPVAVVALPVHNRCFHGNGAAAAVSEVHREVVAAKNKRYLLVRALALALDDSYKDP
ncbi:hypothetical protein BGZ54_003261 [Gamsiella multidivaricata]|nr:hypothetical protein BGZ54_003261 [Gamsiella multidivaricata]